MFYLGSLALCCILSFYLWNRYIGAKKPLPPGPRSIPFVGNFGDFAKSDHWRVCEKWHRQFGPLISFKLGTYTFISIGSQKLGKELLDQRGAIYSSRPRMTFLREHMSKNLQPALLPYNAQWKLLHKLQSRFLSVTAVPAYRPLEELESLHLLVDLLGETAPSPCFHRYGTSLTFALIFGHRMPDGDEEAVRLLRSVTVRKVELFRWVPFLVDAFPILEHLPGPFAKWKEVAQEVHEYEMNEMRKTVNSAMATSNWNWTQEMQRTKEGSKLSDHQLYYLLGELYTAGHLTVVSSLDIFATVSAEYPEAVRRAQLELDTVIGNERLPCFDDMARLPYIKAFMNEILRWCPLIPTGIPHATSRDDEYGGYRIPKGAFILPNHWCMEMDREVHRDPEIFRPERWLEDPSLPLAAFGFGRRSCPGQHMARDVFFIALSRCLWAFDFSKTGGDISLIPKGSGIVSLPTPASVSLTVRSFAHRDIIESSWKDAVKDEGILLSEVKDRFYKTRPT